MNRFIEAWRKHALDIARDEEGAQIVEYGLIIAAVSLALIVAIAALGPDAFSGLLERIRNCVAGGPCD